MSVQSFILAMGNFTEDGNSKQWQIQSEKKIAAVIIDVLEITAVAVKLCNFFCRGISLL